MAQRSFRFGVSLAMLLSLAACGEGGSNSGPVIVTPTPSPSPSPSPSPAPPPANTDLINLKADQTFQTWVTVYAYDWSGTSSQPDIKGDLPPAHDNVLGYLAAGQAYTYNFKNSYIAPSTTTPTFDLSSRQSASSDATYSKYLVMTGSGMFPYNYWLTLFNPGPNNPKVALTYASAGSILLRQATLSSIEHFDQRFFTYGFPTASGNLPTSGTFTYHGVLSGGGLSAQALAPAGVASRQVAVTGTFDATVDFGGRVLSGNVTLLEQVDPSTTASIGTATLGNGVFTALPDLTGKVGSGSLGGFVAGPGAEEIAFTMAFDLPDPRNGGATMHIVASAAGKK